MPKRIVSLDQFRGYTVLGMFVVNFLGGFAVTPSLLSHRDTYFSYADSIMPQFFFAVGFAYHLTFLGDQAHRGGGGLYRRFWRRNARLILLGAVVYLLPEAIYALSRAHPPALGAFLKQALVEELFPTRVHLGVTALWIRPVIAARPAVRLSRPSPGLISLVLLRVGHPSGRDRRRVAGLSDLDDSHDCRLVG
ncbi:MAG: DUF1624 domain-containing protein, partial [Verrucomicrobia subdivision 3 bacterium]|nr:DUF1624 domain-containing protein [Limisphaerales bacterium]